MQVFFNCLLMSVMLLEIQLSRWTMLGST